MSTFMTATQARKAFYTLIDMAKKPGYTVAITHEGIPKVIMMSFDEYEGLMETLEIMSDPDFAQGLKEDIAKAKKGKLDVVDYDTVRARLKL